MAVYQGNPLGNLALGLASLRQPGLLSQAIERKAQAPLLAQQAQLGQLQFEQARQQMEQQKRQQAALGNLGDLLQSQSPYVTRESEGPPQLMGMQEQAGPPQMIPGGFPSTQGPPSLGYPQAQPMLGPQPTEQYSRTGLLAKALVDAGQPGAAISLYSPKPRNLIEVGDQLYDPSTKKWISPPGGTSANFKNEMQLRSKYEDIIKPVEIAANSAAQVDALLKRSGPYSDVASLVSAVKILDPESVVREGEVGIVTSAQGIYDRIVGTLKKATGQGFLSENMKEDMRGALADIMDVYKKHAGVKRGHYSKLSEAYKMEPWRIVGKETGFPKLRNRPPLSSFGSP